MLRPVQAVLAVVLLVACGGTPAPPPPTQVSDARHSPGFQPPPPPAEPSPFRNPTKEPPPPRSQPQLPPAELEAAIAAAAAARAVGDENTAMLRLFTCANKVPQHIRCEGELAMILAKYPSRKAEARYYLEQAVAGDDPGADADFYARLAETLRAAPMWPEAGVALQRRIDRLPEPSAADYLALAELLQGVPKRTAEAVVALQRAFELDPGQLDILRDIGILLSQLPERRAEALTTLVRYREAVRTTEPEKVARAQLQIDQLERDLAVKQQDPAGGPKKPKGPPSPGAAGPSGR